MNSNKCFVTVVVVIGLVLGLFSVTTIANQLTFQGKPVIDGVWRGETAQYIGGEILVLFQAQDVPGLSPQAADDIAKTVGGKIIRGVEADGFAKIEVPVDADIPALCDRLYSDPRVRFAEPNFLTTIAEWNPNDPYYSNGTQWSLRNTGQNPPQGIPDADIDANYAWDITRGSGSVILSILDTGIDMDTVTLVLRHADLNAPGKIIIGPDYVGDGHSVADQNGHGTHVSGIAAAEVNNSTGIAGVAGDCDIMMTQVFNRYGGGSHEALRDGINYSVSYQTSHPSSRVIINYSGGSSSSSDIVYTALDSAHAHGVPFIVASGNGYSSTCLYPCQYSSDLDNIICVGATNPWDDWSTYSNHCSDVNVSAPGGTDLPFDANDIYSCYPPNTYAYDAGTSMAAPHVTGICGLVVSQNISITAANLRTLIQNTADDEVGTLTDDPEGYDTKFGWGRVNAWSAMIHSPAYITPYLRQDQRCSNVYTAAGQNRYYRLAPPASGSWEVAAVRPTTGIDADVAWISTNGSTVLSSSSYGGTTVDFVLANQRPTSGSDYYAKVSDFSGSGKFTVEYQQANDSYIGSMYQSGLEWKSAHVVEIWELYLQNGHTYTFKANVASGEVDVGIALVGRTGSGAYYTQRTSAVFNIDVLGSGGDESTSQTISTGDGWYAFVVWSNNGRNGVMDVYCEERLYSNTSVVLSEQSSVNVSDGYDYEQLTAGSTMGVIGVRPVSGFDYDMYLFNTENYSGSALAGSAYGGEWVDFVLFNKGTYTAGLYYPKVEYFSGSGTSGYTIQTEDTDEFLTSGPNGLFTFGTTSVARAWDVYLGSGTEYQFVGDITSGSLNLAIALYRQDATFKSSTAYLQRAYIGGNGVDETMSWVCDATGYYTLVAWSQNDLAGTYYIKLTSLPNLVTTVATGWDYELVPRNTGGATSGSTHITATLPGNSATTYYNFTLRNNTANAVPTTTFYNRIYADGNLVLNLSRSTGVSGNTTLYYNNYTTTNTMRGGKHTLELRLDGTTTITEFDEDDNSAFRQFVWSPYVLTKDVPVERTGAPPLSYMFTRPNCDGFQFTTTPSYAYAVGICPRGSSDDYDIEGCSDYTGSLAGFDTVKVGSYYTGWYTDYVVATWTGVAATMYPDVYAYSGGSGNYVIEATDTYGRVLGATDEVRHDSLATDQIIHAYEVYLRQDSTYRIILDNLSGSANLDLSLYGPTYGYYSKGSYAAASWTALSDEMITYTATATAYYVITVHKTAYAALPITNVYDLTTELIPPNLTTVVPTGWSYEFVPRNVSGASVGSCLITATLPGNSTGTYLNFCAKNDGVRSVPAVTFYDQLYLDGSSSVFFERPRSTGLTPGSTLYHLDFTSANAIKGGRHTVELRIDGTNTVYETDEGDNSVSRQFVWSPYVLSNGVAVVRSTPPPYDETFPQPNCDGFQYTRHTNYACGIAVCPTVHEDPDLTVYTDYSGSESGFSAYAMSCEWDRGYTDLVVASHTGTATTLYPGIYDYYGTGTNNCVVEAIDSYGKVLSPTDEVVNDTLLSNEILNVYEVYMQAGTSYTITTTALSGTADITMSLYGPTAGYETRASYAANSNVVGSDETIVYTPASTAWFVVVVFKGAYSQLSNSLIYQMSAVLTPPNLTYGTPTGWSYPVVPRNAAGADTNNCVLTATLPGNTAGTYLNFCSYNQGPLPTTTSYFNYIFVDSVSWYGVGALNPHPVGVYAKHLNGLSSNTIRGGRHTMAVKIDRNNSVPESNEDDNWYARQFVWSPYILTDNTPVSRSPAPAYGFETYPNCDGFEFTSNWWGSAGTIPYVSTDDYNLRLHNQWTNSQTGFGTTLAGSGWGVGLSDFVIMNRIYGGTNIYDVGVVKDLTSPGLNYFTIQQANEQITYYTPGTYGPYSLPSNQVMGLWEVYLTTPGIYNFQVDVTAGNADIGTSLYDGSTQYNSKSGYFTGGFSNSAGGGGDESFSITNPYWGMYFGWAVWKVGSADRTLTSTFNLIWSSLARIPMAVDDLVIERVDSTGARLEWSEVTQDTSGLSITINYYRIHRNLNPDFTPSPSDSIGYTLGGTTTYTDAGVIWSNLKYFYKVIAVDTDGVMLDQPNGSDSGRIVVGCPPRADAPEAIRSRYRQ